MFAPGSRPPSAGSPVQDQPNTGTVSTTPTFSWQLGANPGMITDANNPDRTTFQELLWTPDNGGTFLPPIPQSDLAGTSVQGSAGEGLQHGHTYDWNMQVRNGASA